MPPMRATEPPARHQAPGGRGLAWLMDTVTTGNPEPGARWSLMPSRMSTTCVASTTTCSA
jgi:hypothetical protein